MAATMRKVKGKKVPEHYTSGRRRHQRDVSFGTPPSAETLRQGEAILNQRLAERGVR